MTIYNVVEDREEWARIKASLMRDEDRRHLMAELIRRDRAGAAAVLAGLAVESYRRHDEGREA